MLANCSALSVKDNTLQFEGVNVTELAEKHGTPLYLYSKSVLNQQISNLRSALAATGSQFRINYAMKANRFKDIMQFIRNQGDIGIDCCSPNEVDFALSFGFSPNEISFTASNLSNKDLDRLASAKIHVNLDTESAIRRYAARAAPGTKIGLRLCLQLEDGYYGESMVYGDKFGIRLEKLDEIVAITRGYGLEIDTLHFHIGWGLQKSFEASLKEASRIAVECAVRIGTVVAINTGGGLGPRFREKDNPLTADVWAQAIAQHTKPHNLRIECEIGTYIAGPAGIIVSEVNTVEKRGEKLWGGINCGLNLYVFPAYYQIEPMLLRVREPLEEPTEEYSIGGFINEGIDVFARNRKLPTLKEEDLLVIFPTGSYGSSMSSNHCMRGDFTELLL